MRRLGGATTARGAAVVLLAALACAAARADELPGGEAQPVPPGTATDGDLSHVPLDSLAATRERPLFVPSRRPPPPAFVPPPQAPMQPARAEPPPPAPQLRLVGIIRSSDKGRAAVVVDDTDHTTQTLRVGDSRKGWTIKSIAPNEVVLSMQERSTTLTFPPAQAAGGHAPGDDE